MDPENNTPELLLKLLSSGDIILPFVIVILFLWVIFALNMRPASTVKNIANLIFFIIKSRKKQNADDKNIIKNNPIFHSLTL